MSEFMVKWLKLSLVAVVGCGFVAMVVYALWMRDDLQNSGLEPPLVAAPDSPLKRRPEEPGGLEIPNQDKVVFNLLDSPSTQATSQAPVEDDMTDDAMMAEEPVTPPAAVAQVQEQPVQVAVAEPVAQPVVVPEQPVVTEPKVEPKPEPVVVKEEPKPAPEVVPASKGSWGVQLASLGTEADAQRAVEQLKTNAALKALTPNIAKATVGGSTKYRVQFVGLASRDKAAALCKTLKISCLPVAP